MVTVQPHGGATFDTHYENNDGPLPYGTTSSTHFNLLWAPTILRPQGLTAVKCVAVIQFVQEFVSSCRGIVKKKSHGGTVPASGDLEASLKLEPEALRVTLASLSRQSRV